MHLPTRFSLLTLLALSGCWWTAPAHDAGDEAFVAQAIETVLGRKPRGSAEVRALADVVADYGREALLAWLFEQPEYVTYWSNVLADDLELQRSGVMRLRPDCTAPALLDANRQPALADHLATAPIDSPFCYWKPSVRDRPTLLPEDLVGKALDAAMADYDGTPLGQLAVPALLENIPEEPKIGDFPMFEPSMESNLRLAGSGPDNRTFVAPPVVKEVALDWDAMRWLDQRERGGTWECPPFNFTDVLESAVRSDRLDGLYRAYLPVFPATADDPALHASMFLDVYLDRDPTCMTCHSSTWSTTDARPRNRNWDRFDPAWFGAQAPVDVEGSVFSYEAGVSFEYGGDGGAEVRDRTAAFFRGDNFGAAPGEGVSPWGMDPACVPNGLRPSGPGPDPTAFGAFAGIGPGSDLGIVDLVDRWADAVETLDRIAFRRPNWLLYRTSRLEPGTVLTRPPCEGCHTGSGMAPNLADVLPTMTDAQLFNVIRHGSGSMPAVASSDQAAWSAVGWLRGDARTTTEEPRPYPVTPALQTVDRGHAWVLLVGARIVNNVVDEVLGEDLVMIHGFPRNPAQAHALSSLTNTFLVHFSLQDLLTEIVLSDAFNRQAPNASGTVPYSLPMLPDPEAEIFGPAVRPGDNANSEGDFVHRVSPAALFHQVHAALGWPDVAVGAASAMYPNLDLQRSVGRTTERFRPEEPHVSLPVFLAWETGPGRCTKPDRVFAMDVAVAPDAGPFPPEQQIGPNEWVDWIDRLAAESPSRGLTWRDLARSVKDRLLGDPGMSEAEEALIADLWDVDLSGSAGMIADSGGEDMLRDYCGALLSSPQFLLRGPPQVHDRPSVAPRPVCLPDEVCEESAIRDQVIASLEGMGIGPLP